MKKCLLVLGMLALAVSVNAKEIVLRAGLNVSGDEKYSANSFSVSGKTDTGFAFGMEVLEKTGENTKIGAGVEFLFDRIEKEIAGVNVASYESKFGFIPVYGTLNYFFPKSDIFARANLGYNLSFSGNSMFKGNSSLSGGLYWAIGFGTKLANTVRLELVYGTYNGVMKTPSVSVDFAYTPISVLLSFSL